MRTMTRSVIRKMMKMKLRFVGISMVISVAMAMLIAGFYGGDMYDYSIDRYFEENEMPDRFYDLAEPVDQNEVETALSSVQGIDDYQTRHKIGGIYDYQGDVIKTFIIGISDISNDGINIMTMEDGVMFSNIGEAVAVTGMEDVGVNSGDAITFQVGGSEMELDITGTISVPEYMFASAYAEYSIPIGGNLIVIFTGLDTLSDHGFTGINDVIVSIENDAQATHVDTALEPFGVTNVIPQNEHPAQQFMDIGAAKMRGMFPVMGAIFLLVGFISVFMTIYRLVKNDSRYIGVMMSLGYERKEIIRSYLALGLMIIIVGGFLGTIFALGFTMGIVSAASLVYSNMKLYFPFSPLPFLIGWLFTIFSVLLSVWIPASLITKVSVREALEYKPKGSVHKARIKGSGMSRVTLMGLRNSTRNSGRTVLTILVVGMTIGTAGAWLVMMDSAYGYMGETLDMDTWDLRGDFSAPINDADLSASSIGLNDSDISYMYPFSHMAGNVISGSKSTTAIVLGCNNMTQAKDFNLEKGQLDFTGAVVSFTLAQELSLSIGDQLSLDVGGRTESMALTGIVHEMLGLTLYTDRDNLASIFPADQSTGVFVQLNDNNIDNAEEKAALMRQTPIISNVVVQDNIADTLFEVMDLALSVLYAFFIFNGIIAFIVASSAVIISTMERDIEFATLDTLGISRWKVAKSILVEMLVLAVGSSLVGLPLSYLFGWFLMKALEEVIFYFPILFVIGSAIATFVMGIVFVTFSSIVPIRYSKALDTERTLRERTAG